MKRLSQKAFWTIFFLVLLAGFAAAGLQAAKRPSLTAKDVSACELQVDEYFNTIFNTCATGAGSCYYCEYTNRNGSYSCVEAADPADGKFCWSIDYQLP